MTSQPTTDVSPALAASQASWRAVQANDRDAWLALMADDVLIEDPIGRVRTNSDGTGVRGKENVEAFYDTTIAKTTARRITCEETFPSSSPDEIAHILNLHFEFEGGFTATCAASSPIGSNDAGLLTNLRGYWNMDMMTFGQADKA